MSNYTLDPRGLANVTEVINRFIDEKKIAGASMYIARGGAVQYNECFGYMDVEAGKPVAHDTIYRMASMTKPVTMTAIMKLYEKGLFRLYDPVSEFIPEFADIPVAVQQADGTVAYEKQAQPMTIKNLLTMTSGMPYGERRPGRATPASLKMADLGDSGALDGLSTLEHVKTVAKNVPLAFQPGTQWLYGFSHDVVGALIQVLSGQRFGDFVKENIFDPLGMVDSGFYIAPEKADRLCKFYTLDGELTNVEPNRGDPCVQPAFESGGGGLFSTINDYGRFAQMLCDGGVFGNERILGRKTVELMTSDHLDDVQKKTVFRNWKRLIGSYSYGLGMRVMVNPAYCGYNGTAGEFGWDGATGTWFCVDPKEKLVAIFLQQSVPSGHEWYEPLLIPAIYSSLV